MILWECIFDVSSKSDNDINMLRRSIDNILIFYELKE